MSKFHTRFTTIQDAVIPTNSLLHSIRDPGGLCHSVESEAEWEGYSGKGRGVRGLPPSRRGPRSACAGARPACAPARAVLIFFSRGRNSALQPFPSLVTPPCIDLDLFTQASMGLTTSPLPTGVVQHGPAPQLLGAPPGLCLRLRRPPRPSARRRRRPLDAPRGTPTASSAAVSSVSVTVRRGGGILT